MTPWAIESMDSPGQNTGVDSLSLLRGIFPIQGLNSGKELQVNSLPAEPQGKPKTAGVGSLSLLQGFFPTQESNRGLLHCRWILYQLNYEGSPSPKQVSESHSVMSNFLRPHGLYSLRNSPGQNTGVDSLSLLQGIFPTQGSNPGLPHCTDSLPAEPHGKPNNTRLGILSLL